jgi:chromosomal replication initiator protein
MTQPDTTAQSARHIWTEVCADLRSLLGDNAHRSWTARLRLHSADDNCVKLIAPSRFVANRIIQDYGQNLQSLWATRDSRQVFVGLAGDFALQTQADAQSDSGLENKSAAISLAVQTQTPIPSQNAPQSAPQPALRLAGKDKSRTERFTFDNFVVGPTNELAHAVARKVVASRSSQYNPVVIHGPHGMGKTHLLHAVKNQIERDDPSRRVHMISSEQFVASFVTSLRGGSRAAVDVFKKSMRDVDLLIIDDAHFIADKPTSQEELLHTLISLVDNGRQVLLATDRHPHAITKATERLKSYLCAGLLCDIGPADYELRRRILDRLIETKRESGNPDLAMPEQARDHLAARINATPRDLEGAFNQVVARSEFLGRPLTLESVQEALSHSRYNNGMRPTVDRIQKAAAKQFGITMDDMLSKRRARAIARPRQAAMYLAKTLTTRSLPDIGRRFGGRDHTTVIHAVKRIEALRMEDPVLDANIEAVVEALKS